MPNKLTRITCGILYTPSTAWSYIILFLSWWISWPFFMAYYFYDHLHRGDYPTNADSIGLPIGANLMAYVLLIPLVVVLLFRVKKRFRTKSKIWLLNYNRPFLIASLLLTFGSLASLNLILSVSLFYDRSYFFAVNSLLGFYLFLCLPSIFSQNRGSNGIPPNGMPP